MQRFALPIVIAITALLTGVIIGRYTASSIGGVPSRRTNTRSSTDPAAATTSPNPPPVSSRNSVAASESTAPATADSSENIIAKIKEALTHPGSRRTYATFSKLAETVDATKCP